MHYVTDTYKSLACSSGLSLLLQLETFDGQHVKEKYPL